MPYDKYGRFSNIDPRALMAMAQQHQDAMRKKIAEDIAKYGHTSFTYPMGSIDETAKMVKMQDYLRPRGDPDEGMDRSDATLAQQGQETSDKLSTLLQREGVFQTTGAEDRERNQLLSLADKLQYLGKKRKKNF